MKTFFASVCTAAVAAGILTATAANVERTPAPQEPAPVVNRVAKTDRWLAPRPGTIMVRTQSIPAAAYRQEARALTACDSLVSPLADPVVSRRARECAT